MEQLGVQDQCAGRAGSGVVAQNHELGAEQRAGADTADDGRYADGPPFAKRPAPVALSNDFALAMALWHATEPPDIAVTGRARAGPSYLMVVSGRALLAPINQEATGGITAITTGYVAALAETAPITVWTIGEEPLELFLLAVTPTDDPATLAMLPPPTGLTCPKGEPNC